MEGKKAALLTVRILAGEKAERLADPDASENAYMVDWRQLQRWGIDESRVPAGTIVRFREPSLFERYKVYIIAVVALLLAQTALIAALLVQRSRRRQAESHVRGREAELRTSYERIRDLGTRLLDAQDRERARIARELHDDISQQLALLEIDLEILNGTTNGSANGLAGEVLGRARSIGRSLHDLSHRLHPAKLRLIGLVPALAGLLRELGQSGAAIAFTHANVPPTLPPELTLCLFRVVQEAVQNALKHGRARHVSVELHGGADGLALTIADDGVGFDVEAQWGKGLGLISMRERLDAAGGTLDLRSSPTGTRLSITVPLSAAEEPRTVAV
jgi:signal transduction histidine kinase